MSLQPYIISLPTASAARKHNIRRQMAKLGLPYQVVDGIDGKQLDINTDQRIHPNGQWLRAGQVGCALSHLKAYKQAQEKHMSHALIFEDDFKVKSNFATDLPIIRQYLTDKSVCLFHTTTFPGECLILDKQSAISLPSRSTLYQIKSGRPLCATAYLISLSAYQSLLENHLPIQTVADDWSRFLSNGWIDCIYVVDPPPVGVQHFPSQIGYGEGAGKLQKLANMMIRHNLPVFRNISTWWLDREFAKNMQRIIE